MHQFCRVGRHAYLGGYTRGHQDALPFVKTVGLKPACYGLNSIGLKRKGLAPETHPRGWRPRYRLLVRSRSTDPGAWSRSRAELAGDPDVDYLVAFVESAQRGVIKSPPRGGGRGGGEPRVIVHECLRVGVFGTGSMGRHHVRMLSSLPGVELVGIYDRAPEAAEAVAARARRARLPAAGGARRARSRRRWWRRPRWRTPRWAARCSTAASTC